MSATPTVTPVGHDDLDYRHEAFFYAGLDEFVKGSSSFIEGALDRDQAVLVVVAAHKIDALREQLGGRADGVLFADMVDLGRNPARIIPAWREFLDQAGSGGVRGIGEPIWAGRTPAELTEAQRHEALLNVAFEATSAFWLLCPYDVDALADDVIDIARQTHPFLAEGGRHFPSADFGELHPFAGMLPEPSTAADVLDFGPGPLVAIRRFVSARANAWGLDPARTADVVVAVNELVTNSLRHGGGHGRVRAWHDAAEVLFEVSDEGLIDEVLVGRERPSVRQHGGRGLWIVNHLCDLVEIRSSVRGTTVRVHMARTRD